MLLISDLIGKGYREARLDSHRDIWDTAATTQTGLSVLSIQKPKQ